MNTAITDLLPAKSNIHDTPFEDLVNNTIGYFFELIEADNDEMTEGCFIQTAEGKYLDLYGKDYNLRRFQGESDDDYRTRLMIAPLEEFTINTLYTLYDVQLLTYNEDYNDLMLLSDNHLLNNKYLVEISDELWNDISKKFITMDILERYEHE